MKKLLGICAAAVLLVGFGVEGARADAYFSANLGVVMASDADFDDGVDTGTISFDPGFGATVAVGSQLGGETLRGELEVGYRANDLDEAEIDGVGTFSASGDYTNTSLMANLFFDIAPNNPVSPFLGGGAGFSIVEIEGGGASADETVFSYQLAAGAAFAVNDKTSVDVQYRYFATEDPDLDGLETEYATHNLMVGLRFMF